MHLCREVQLASDFEPLCKDACIGAYIYYQSIFKRNNNFFSYYQIPRYIASEEVQWDLMPLLGIIELYYKAHPILREGDRRNIEITVSADGVSYYKNRYWF